MPSTTRLNMLSAIYVHKRLLCSPSLLHHLPISSPSHRSSLAMSIMRLWRPSVFWPHIIGKGFGLHVVMCAIGICVAFSLASFNQPISFKLGWSKEDRVRGLLTVTMPMCMWIIWWPDVFHFVYASAFGAALDGAFAGHL